jgi:hypothetical protein
VFQQVGEHDAVREGLGSCLEANKNMSAALEEKPGPGGKYLLPPRPSSRTIPTRLAPSHPRQSMPIPASASRANQTALAHLRTLRLNLDQARSALMHFKDDRIDRDKLEPAARRVDDLINLFAIGPQDAAQGLAWLNEIRRGLDTVANPKSVAKLEAARVEITALLALLAGPRPVSATGGEQPA